MRTRDSERERSRPDDDRRLSVRHALIYSKRYSHAQRQHMSTSSHSYVRFQQRSSYKCSIHLLYLYFSSECRYFSDIHISQGSVATCSRRGEICKHAFVANLLLGTSAPRPNPSLTPHVSAKCHPYHNNPNPKFLPY